MPWQAPPQPAKLAPDAGTAVSVTVVFVAYSSSQSRLPLPQLTPGPVTRPLPVTPRRTGTVPVALLKDAVAFCDALIVTVQVVEVPLHAPSQPENVAPVSGVAVSVTKVPGLYDSEQSVLPAPQLIPLPVTLPLAAGLTVRVGFPPPPPPPPPEVKVAVTALAEPIVTVQAAFVPAAVQSPPQPVKVAPESGMAVRVTDVPSA